MLDRFITPGPLPSANEAELLIILAEECNEAAARVSKALRFGLNEVQPGQDATNAERIGQELQDVAALVSLCVEAGILSVDLEEPEARRKKLQKLYRFCQREENRALAERLLTLLPQTGEAEPEKPLPASVSEVERDTLSDLEICNLALSRIAAEPISSLDENSSAARHCAELYAPTLDNLLRCGTWPYRPLLANALSWRLAADLASALRDDVARRHEAMAEFSRALLANKEAEIAEKAIADALSKREDG